MRKQRRLWRFKWFGYLWLLFSTNGLLAQTRLWHSATLDGKICFSVLSDTLIALDTSLYVASSNGQKVVFRNDPFHPIFQTSLDLIPSIPGWTLLSGNSIIQLIRNQEPASPLPYRFRKIEIWHQSLLGQTDLKWVWHPGSPFELWADSVHIYPSQLVLYQQQGIVLIDTTLHTRSFPIKGEKRLLSPHFSYVLVDSIWQPIVADHRSMVQKPNGFWWNDTSLIDSANRQVFMQTSHQERTLIGDSISIINPNFLLLRKMGKYNLVTSSGAKIKLPVKFRFSLTADNLLAVWVEKSQYLMDVSGRKTVFNKSITAIKGISDGLIMAKDKMRFGFVDMHGYIRIACRYDSLLPFYQGLAGAQINNRWGFLNRDEKIVIQPHFQEVYGPRDELYKVQNDGKWGLIRTDGETVLSCQFDAIEPTLFSGWHIKKGNWQGWANEKGEVMIQPKYFSTIEVGFGHIRLGRNGKFGLANSEGKVTLPIDYQNIIVNPKLKKIFFY